MGTRLFSRFLTYLLLLCSVLGLLVFFASMFTVEWIARSAASTPTMATPLHRYAAQIDGGVHFLTQDQDTVLSYAEPGIWIGILTAFFLALIYCIVQEDRSRAPE